MAGADLHLHSTASDGLHPPAEVVRRAAAAGLRAVALTDHDTIAGLGEARTAASVAGIRVVGGCEFSVAAPWGEMHLLAYCLPDADPALDGFLLEQRGQRTIRMREIARRLGAAGVALGFDDIATLAGGAALGRPHAARALVARGTVRDVSEAFERYLGRGRVAYVPKRLPALAQVTGLVRRLGGVTAAAHLKERGTPAALTRLGRAGVDGIEVRHPAHDPELERRLTDLARERGMLPTGGTDWHGDSEDPSEGRAPLGAVSVPLAWLEDIELLHRRRREERTE